MSVATVPAILGGAQLIGGVSKAASERKQVKAQNEAQKVQLAAQEKQIEAQEKATYEQSVLAQMELQQNRAFSEYQSQLGALQRQTAFLQQTSTLSAQSQMENIQASAAQAQNQMEQMGAQLQATQGLLGNNTQYMNTLIEGAQAGTQNEQQRYNTLAQADEARLQGIAGQANANINAAQQNEQLANEGRQVFNQLEGQEVEAQGKLKAGDRRRAAQSAMFAASGMGGGGLTDRAVIREDLITDLASDVEQRAISRGIAAETMESMVRSGRINELARNLGYEQGAIQERRALEQAILANTIANNQNTNLGQQVGYAGQVRGMNNNLVSGQLELANLAANANSTNIDAQTRANQLAQQASMQQFNAAMTQDEHTDRINRIMAESGFQLQSGAAASQAQASLSSLAAQRQSLVYTPQRAPSLLGSVLSSGINAANAYMGGVRQQQQQTRANNISMGQVTGNTSLLGQ